MGRKFNALSAVIALSIVGSGLVCGQPPQHGQQPPQRPGGPPGGPRGKGPGDLGFSRERFRQLSTEDRQRFNRNAERWMKMDAEERKIMRDREKLRRERIKQEAQAALRDSGLRLDEEKRAQFESRYLQERTKIEHAMRQELETKRQQQVPALIEQLKKEFQQQQPKSSGTPKPLASPSRL